MWIKHKQTEINVRLPGYAFNLTQENVKLPQCGLNTSELKSMCEDQKNQNRTGILDNVDDRKLITEVKQKWIRRRNRF